MALLLSCCWLCGLWAAAQEMEAVAPTSTPERYQNGWYGMAQTQTLFGETTNKQATVHLGTQGAAGYRFHPALQVGLGVGVAAYPGNIGEEFIIPAFLEMRGNVLRGGRISPFYLLQGGHTFLQHKETTDWGWTQRKSISKGGLYLSGGLGLNIRLTANTGLLVGAQYQVQHNEYTETYTDGSYSIRKKMLYKRVALSTGIVF